MALPSVFATASVTLAASASLSDPFAVAPLARSVTVAVLTSGFVLIAAENATGTVNTSAFAPPASTRAAVAPKLVWPVVPVTVPQLDVPPARQVAFADSVTPAGSGSATVTFSASLWPVFATVTM